MPSPSLPIIFSASPLVTSTSPPCSSHMAPPCSSKPQTPESPAGTAIRFEVWVAYKESNWLNRIFWVILVFLGSIGTCAYMVKQFFSIQAQDSSQDPVHLALLRKYGECKVICSFIVLGRIVFSVLGVTMSVILGYTLVTDGSPFRMELLTPWMTATLIGFYINVFVISVWVWHKESSWIRAIFWASLLICFGSIATCAYIMIQLSKLSCKNPRV